MLTPTVDDLQDDISLLGVPPIVSLQTPVTLSERESFYKEMDSLRAECEILKLNSENKNIHAAFTMKAIKKNPEKCVMLTGLKYEVLLVMIDYLCENQKNYCNKLALNDQILLILIKLKQHYFYNACSYM